MDTGQLSVSGPAFGGGGPCGKTAIESAVSMRGSSLQLIQQLSDMADGLPDGTATPSAFKPDGHDREDDREVGEKVLDRHELLLSAS
jgi:hypothetical protein